MLRCFQVKKYRNGHFTYILGTRKRMFTLKGNGRISMYSTCLRTTDE